MHEKETLLIPDRESYWTHKIGHPGMQRAQIVSWWEWLEN